MPRRLPPLNAIRAFEASARHGGFAAAAQELRGTSAAVSLQIRKLEGLYEGTLFHRLPSGVDLTEVGAAIFADCTAALSTLQSPADHVEKRDARSWIVISCINSLAHCWLALQLAELSARVPESWIEFRAEPDPVDFEDRGGDLRITRGDHLYPHHDSRALFTDRLTPVCTPDVTRRVALAGQSPQDLPEESLIHTWWSPSLWGYPTWVDWFAHTGQPRQPRPGVGPAANMPAVAINMALAGMGGPGADVACRRGPARQSPDRPLPRPPADAPRLLHRHAPLGPPQGTPCHPGRRSA